MLLFAGWSFARKPAWQPAREKRGDGIPRKAFTWVMAGSVIAFAVTLNRTVYFWVLGSAFAVDGICLVVVKKRRTDRKSVV